MNKKLFKSSSIIAIIFIFIFAFSSSYSSLNLDKLIYVLAIGIDKTTNNQLEVTFQFSNPLSPDSGGSEKAETIINTVTASSLSNAINLANSYQGRQLNLSHCKIIIFSEEIASTGISDEIYTLINDTQIRPSSNIIISKCSAKYYIEQTKPEVENLISKYYETFADSSRYTGQMPDATIGKFFNNLICQFILSILCTYYRKSQVIMTLLYKRSNNIENIGVAVFKDDILVGELNATETIAFLNMKNKVDRFLISVPDPLNYNNYIDIYVTPLKSTKIKVDTSYSYSVYKSKLLFYGKDLFYVRKF